MGKFVQSGIAIAIFLYLFKDFDIERIKFSDFNLYAILLTNFFLALSQLILAVRWRKMSNLSFKISLETITVSSVLNIILPARLGEVSKAYYLKKFYNYNYHKSISVIFVERFFDVIMLFVIVCAWAYTFFVNDTVKNSILILSFSILATLYFFNSKRGYRLIKKIPIKFARVYLKKIYKNINYILKSPFSIFFITALLWILYLFSYFSFFAYGCDFKLSVFQILELFIFSTVALSLPLTPAGIGTFEGSIVLYLTHLGIEKSDALIAATLYHLIIFLVDFIFFYIFLIVKDIKFSELVKRKG